MKIISVLLLAVSTCGAIESDKTAREVAQVPDGSITLLPRTAEIKGGPIVLVDGKEPCLSMWSDPAAYPQWIAALHLSGTFTAELNYSLEPAGDGTEINVSIGDQQLSAKLAATRGWTEYRTITLGDVKLDAANPLVIAIKATKKPGYQVMHFRELVFKRHRIPSDASTPTAGNLVGKEAPFKARTQKPIGIVFFGDSITNDWPDKSPDTWKRFDKYDQADFGISGERTENVLWRMLHGDLDGYHARVVVIMVGTNNFGHFPNEKPEWAAAGIKKILETVREKQPDAKILLLATFPREEKDSLNHVRVDELNKIIQGYTDGKAIHWLDVGDLFLDAKGNVDRTILTDGLHPNDRGYHLWYDRMWPSLEKLLEEK